MKWKSYQELAKAAKPPSIKSILHKSITMCFCDPTFIASDERKRGQPYGIVICQSKFYQHNWWFNNERQVLRLSSLISGNAISFLLIMTIRFFPSVKLPIWLSNCTIKAAHNHVTSAIHQVIFLLDYLAILISTIQPELC